MNTIAGRLVYAPFPFTAFHPQAETLSLLADISEQNKGPMSRESCLLRFHGRACRHFLTFHLEIEFLFPYFYFLLFG
jgi:hypothetical protein